MNVTSMLSSGYLQPLRNFLRPVDDPEQTLRDMEQMQRAALAPNSPSGQDLSLAAKAAAFSGVSSVKAGLIFERLHEENEEKLPTAEKLPAGAMPDPIAAYGRNASSRGLWTLRRGFEPVPKMAVLEPSFDMAA